MNCFVIYISYFASSHISCPIRFLELLVLLVHSVEVRTSYCNLWGAGTGAGRSLGICPISSPSLQTAAYALHPSVLFPNLVHVFMSGFLALTLLTCPEEAHLCQLFQCAWHNGLMGKSQLRPPGKESLLHLSSARSPLGPG